MANYFTSADDAAYLDATTAARSDLGLLRTDAEAIVLAQYRRSIRDTRFTAAASVGSEVTVGLANLQPNSGDVQVMLRYYKADAGDVGASDNEVAFLAAIKREIAGVIKHLASQRPDGGASERPIKSESRGRRSVTYADESVNAGDLPTGFGRFLKPFDAREVNWTI